jgi:uncharacterized membrane protein
MPFPTYLLGLYGDYQTIVIFYASIAVITSAILFLLWRHASENHLLIDSNLDADMIRFLMRRSLIPVIIFLASIGIAIFSPLLAMITWVLNFFVVYGYTRISYTGS